jgi:hypothetical protein
MLRGRKITRAALIAALALWASPALPMLCRRTLGGAALVLALGLCASPVFAQVDGETETPGKGCPTSATPGQAASANWDTIFECNSSNQWQRGPYFFGSTSDTCDSNHAGMVQYTSGTLEACNGTSWIPIDGGMHFIATQTASASASLQFTNLPTSYNTLFLNCVGLVLSATNNYIYGYVGEGATPTWETGAHYYDASNDFPGNENNNTTATDIFNNLIGTATSTTPITIKLYMDNVGSSSLYKMITYDWGLQYNGNGIYGGTGRSNWHNDTNAITGFELAASAGTITSGTCSLYGMN